MNKQVVSFVQLTELYNILNEFVWRTQSEEFWVNFKVWGLLPITFIFTAFQIG